MSKIMTAPAITYSPIVLTDESFDEWQANLNEQFPNEPEIDRVLSFARRPILESVLNVIGKLRIDANGTIAFTYRPSALLLAAARATHRGDLAWLCDTFYIAETDVIEQAEQL